MRGILYLNLCLKCFLANLLHISSRSLQEAYVKALHQLEIELVMFCKNPACLCHGNTLTSSCLHYNESLVISLQIFQNLFS